MNTLIRKIAVGFGLILLIAQQGAYADHWSRPDRHPPTSNDSQHVNPAYSANSSYRHAPVGANFARLPGQHHRLRWQRRPHYIAGNSFYPRHRHGYGVIRTPAWGYGH